MKKLLYCFVIALTLVCGFGSDVFASNIKCAVDNEQDAVIYRSFRRLKRGNAIGEFDIMKTVFAEGNHLYQAQIVFKGAGYHKRFIDNKANIIIDGEKYEVNKIKVPMQYVIQAPKNYLRGTYLIPDEIMEKMANAKNSLVFEYLIKETGLRSIQLRSYDIDEVKLIAKLGYNDFEDVKNKKIRP